VYDATTGTNQYVHINNITGTSVTPTTVFAKGHFYQWWVRAWSNNGDDSAWCSTSLFRT
jgi:hypothetical protein